jgi:hypothetical protein
VHLSVQTHEIVLSQVFFSFLSSRQEMSDTMETVSSQSARFLQSQRDRVDVNDTISVVLFVLLLALCFLLPLLLRGSVWDQDTEDAPPVEDGPGATTVQESAEEQSETRAMRKKYRAERRARIVQVFSPVSLVSL